jgi:hypothetical protein
MQWQVGGNKKERLEIKDILAKIKINERLQKK